MNSRLIDAIVGLMGILLAFGALPAGASSSAVVHVQATIRPWLKLSATLPISHYRVTTEDIRRGYVDLPGAIAVKFQTNVREEVSIEVDSVGPEHILVHGTRTSGSEIRFAGAHPAAPEIRILDVRVVLPPGIREGSYPFKVVLTPKTY